MEYDGGFPDDFELYYEGMVDEREREDIMNGYVDVLDLGEINSKISRAEGLKSELSAIMTGLRETKEVLQGVVEQIEELEEDMKSY